MRSLLLLALLLPGCVTAEYTDPAGRSFKITKFATNTKVGKVSAHAPDGTTFYMEQLDSESKAVELAALAVSAALKAKP